MFFFAFDKTIVAFTETVAFMKLMLPLRVNCAFFDVSAEDPPDPGHPDRDAARPGSLHRRGAGGGGALLLPGERGVAQPDGHRGLDHGEGGLPAAWTGEAVCQPLPPLQRLAKPATGDVMF